MWVSGCHWGRGVAVPLGGTGDGGEGGEGLRVPVGVRGCGVGRPRGTRGGGMCVRGGGRGCVRRGVRTHTCASVFGGCQRLCLWLEENRGV